MSKLDIEAEAKRRNIEYLCHFTRIENVPDIVREGLISRAQLNHIGRNGKFNDDFRYDDQDGAICCSVSFPNYRVFFPFRCNISCAGWVVVILRPEVLWEKECAFSIENAARNSVSSIPIQYRIGIDPFKAMFNEWPGQENRTTLGLTDEYPTNPQAEVLVGDPIEPHYIYGFATMNEAHANDINAAFGAGKAACMTWCFERRNDWQYWS